MSSTLGTMWAPVSTHRHVGLPPGPPTFVEWPIVVRRTHEERPEAMEAQTDASLVGRCAMLGQAVRV